MENGEKKSKPITYPLEKTFTAKNTNNNIVVVQLDTPQGPVYRSVLNAIYDEQQIKHYSAGEVVIIEPFKETIRRLGLEVLLKDSYGNDKAELTIGEINKIAKSIKVKSNLNPNEINTINRASGAIANVISDLLGLNVKVNPSSPLRLAENRTIEEVIIPAKKLVLFKETLIRYLSASFLTEKVVLVSNYNDGQDYRVARSLGAAKIKTTENVKRNLFSLKADLMGNLQVDGSDVHKKAEPGFQKIFKI